MVMVSMVIPDTYKRQIIRKIELQRTGRLEHLSFLEGKKLFPYETLYKNQNDATVTIV